jgi:2-methylcitrate dehydratase PrpD
MQKSHPGFTQAIAQFIVETAPEAIPADAYEQAKVAFLDWLAVLLAGKDEPLVVKLIEQAKMLGGHEQATILGHGLKTNVSLAALVNGSASHALDYDDNLKAFSGHPSVTLFPGLVALSEWQEKSGMAFLTAYIIGLEAACAIGACMGFKEHYGRGWHGTSTLGRFAAAAACSRLLGLNIQQTLYALSIAGTQASGLRRVFGTMCKPLHAGKASQIGLESALLAQDGFTGVEDILEGPQGFFQVMGGKEDDASLEALGQSWQIRNLSQKFHASCLETHGAMEAALNIATKNRLLFHEIRSVKIRTTPICMNVAGIQEPKTGLEGKFSIPYCVANALLRSNTGPQAFTDEKVLAPEIRQFMKKISVRPASEFEGVGVAAEVVIKDIQGREFQEYFDPLVAPPIEVKKEKVKSKFMNLCRDMMGEKAAIRAVDAILAMEKTPSMRELVSTTLSLAA